MLSPRPGTALRVLIALLLATFGLGLVPLPATAASPGTTLTWPTQNREVRGDLFISGTATADPGVRHVELVLRNTSTGRYWNGSSWQTRWVRYPVEVSGSPSSTTWSERIPASELTQGRYFARAWTRSTSGGGDPVGDTRRWFTWNDRPQEVGQLEVTGTTANSVTVKWKNDADDRLKSFDFFVNNSYVTYSSSASTTSHTFTGLAANTSYQLGVTAHGDPSHTYTNQSYSPRVNVSATTAGAAAGPPKTTLTEPANNATVEGDLRIAGTASASDGVRAVELVLRNLKTRKYWNGSGWQTRWVRYPVTISGSPTSTNWSETIPASALSEARYFARAWTRSSSGKGDPVGDTRTWFNWSPGDGGGEETVLWEDNFTSLDTSKWKLEHSTYGDGNNEAQCYRPGNVSVRSGKLVLRAIHETYTCPNGSTRVVTSGMVRSKGVQFAPGQAIEFRVKLTPASRSNQAGLWPGVWASGWAGGGWPHGGEMDWLEVMTANSPARSVYTIHYQQPNGRHGKSGKEHFYQGGEYFSDDWRTIRFDYGHNGVLVWYLDGVEVNRVTNASTAQGWPAPFDQATKEIKINLALGGNPGPLEHAALGDDGATFEVDYIRILSLN